MQQRNFFYFLLYLVVAVELLVVIMDRDDAEEDLIKLVLKTLEQPPALTVSPINQWVTLRDDSVVVSIAGLKTLEEKSSLQFRLIDRNTPQGYSVDVVKDTATGMGKFFGKFSVEGEYTFEVYCEVDRRLPDNLPEAIRRKIEERNGIKVRLSSDTAMFLVRVGTVSPPGSKFTLRVDKGHDNWVIGRRYVKTIFVGGTEATTAKFSVSDPRLVLTVVDVSKVQLTWTNPTEVKTLPVTVRGDANRGLGTNLDVDAVTFTVDVSPPRWDPEPQGEAYWKVPYIFNSRVGWLEAGEYTIQVFANRTIPIDTLSAYRYPYKFVPEQQWTSLTFTAISADGAEMLTKEIPVKPPKPPQIKWSGSTLQENDFIISFTCMDVNGDSVTVHCDVAQPLGLKSSLNGVLGNAVRGRGNFSLKVINVTATKPPAVVVRASATGIGGTSRTLDRTFNVLY
jgi:hypothetical protein